ncbi:glycosyltransferase [Rhizobium sp. KVB221]|uniref:Glycosyltransferase n=1 Tax=Rhizobium setariae TaxID=2801340 RepID=A0A937CQ25_9HYPH|nr:glycosyltransferase [Rhizobium setariae]MBL0373283.1 glycosyltransferase [Rhizobium setariae]
MENYRVLNCITGLNFGGAELMLARFARKLGETAYSPQVLSLMPPGPVGDLLERDGVPVASLGMAEARITLGAFARLPSSIRRTDSDLLHGWMYHGNVAASLGALAIGRLPVIWSIHHSIDDIAAEKRLTRMLIRLSARLSRGTAAISYCSRVSARQHEALGFDPSKREIIPNGIDCTEFQPRQDARQRLCSMFSIPPERSIIGNIARAHPMKDHEGFVRSLAQLRQEGHDVHGLIVGAGHEEGAARRLARELDIDDRLTTPGPRSDIAEFLPGLDVFLLSSAWGEAFPLSVGEAMACGVPVVATDVGDCNWLIGNDEMISRPRDPVGQAAVIGRILAMTADERRNLGLAGRHRVVGSFSLEKYTESHIRIYEAAIDNQHRRRGMQ